MENLEFDVGEKMRLEKVKSERVNEIKLVLFYNMIKGGERD